MGTRKIPSWSIPLVEPPPDQIPPNLTLTLTQVGIHQWGIDQGGIFRTPSNVFIKISRFLFSTVKLKSPINIIFSYSQDILVRASDRFSRKYCSFVRPMQRHFRILMANSIEVTSQSSEKHSKSTVLQGLFLLMWNIIPPPCLFLSLLNIL